MSKILISTYVVKSLVGTGLAQSLVGGELSLVLGDRAGSLGGVNLHHRNDSFRLKKE